MSREQRIKKPKTCREMAQIFRRKSGAWARKKSRTKEKQEWRKEYDT